MDELINGRNIINAISTWDKFGVDERNRIVRWHEGLEPYVHLRDVVVAIENLPSAQMTVEELKKIANEMGYNIIKKQEYVKLLPCKCGCNRREHWYGVKKDDAYILKCENCGAKAMGSTIREANLNWNRMVRGEEDEID